MDDMTADERFDFQYVNNNKDFTIQRRDVMSTIAWISSDYFESLLFRQLERRLKSEFGFFQSLSQLFLPTLSNVGEPARNWIPRDHIQVQKEKQNFVVACLCPP